MLTGPTLTVYTPAKREDTGTAMIICPGGGYHNLFWESSKARKSRRGSIAQGMTGIILKYRCPRRPGT